MRSEMRTRRLSKFIGNEVGEKLGVRRSDFSVLRKMVPLARIVDVTSDDYRIQWNTATRDDGLARADIAARFRESLAAANGAAVSWG